MNEHFIIFFRNYFIKSEYTPDRDVTIRFYTTLLNLYIIENNNFDKSLIKSWENEMKPYILQKYPVALKGYFNANSDLHYLIKLIDDSKEKFKVKQIEEEKNNKDKEIKTDDNNNINNNIQDENKDNKIKLNEERKKMKKFKKEFTTIFNAKKNEEEDIKILRRKNMPKISKFIEEFIQTNKLNIKRANSMINLRPHSQTIVSASTCDDSICNEESNLNINQLINNNEKKESINKKQSNALLNDLYKENNKNKNEKKSFGIIERSKTILLRDMLPKYKEEEEDESNIVYKKPENKLCLILTDIMIKKIIFENFMNDNVLLLYHFCQQCFCFVNKEVFFKKLINCYKYYKNKNTSLNYIKNLIEFINILIIEMFEYYQKLNSNDVTLKIIKDFYHELINDLLLNYKEEEENIIVTNDNNNDNDKNNIENEGTTIGYENAEICESGENIKNKNIDNFNDILNRKNLIKMNLNTENENIKIFILKEIKKEKKQKEEKTEIKKEQKQKEKKAKIKQNEEKEEKTKIKKEEKSEKVEKKEKVEKTEKKEEKSEKQEKSDKEEKSEKEEKTKKEENKDKNKDENNNDTKDFKEDLKQNINIINNKNNYNIKRPNVRNTISFKNIPKKENEGDKKVEKETPTPNEEEKKEPQKFYQISRTLRKSQMIKLKGNIKDIILEEKDENSDEDNKTNKSNKSDKFAQYSDISEKDSDDDNEIENKKENEKEEKEKLETINNLVDNIFLSKKIISIKDGIIQKMYQILLLLDIKDGEEPSFHDIRDAQENIPFYGMVNKLTKENNKKFNIQPQKRLTKTSFFSKNYFSSGGLDNERDYLSKGYFCICDWKTEEIGDKLTQVTKSLLNKIHPKEIYRGIFLKKDKEKTSPHVVECINNFNRLTSFIIEDILSFDYPKERAKVYDKWVQVADYCRTNKNYNDCIAIYSALNNYIITGLKLTFKEIKSKTKSIFEQISNLCSCEGNYKKIREDMLLCEKNGQVFIPYLGMLLRDINFYEESSKYINQLGCINMEKIENINTIMERYFRYKNYENKLTRNYRKIKELNFFEKLEDIKEEKLEAIAKNIEPVFLIGIPKIKRPTNIDRKFFEKYANDLKMKKNMTINMRNTVAHRAFSFSPY